MLRSRLPTSCVLPLILVFVVALAAPTTHAQSGRSDNRIDTEFQMATDLSDTAFQTEDDQHAGVRKDGITLEGTNIGSISNSPSRALYIEGQDGGLDTPVTVFSRDVNTTDSEIVGLYFRVKPGDDAASPDKGRPDERLRVEYRDASGTWQVIESLEGTGDGEDGPYRTFTDTLTSEDAALHANFSLRFRIDGTSARDPWYIDDMCVLPGGGTCTPGNTIPSLSNIPDQTIDEKESTGPIDFTVKDADGDALTVEASSNAPTLLPDDQISLGGSGTTRTIEVTPADGASGTGTVTVTVQDGTDEVSETFQVTVKPDVVLTSGRQGDYEPPAGQPGTDDNPVGRLELSTDAGTATLTSLTVREDASPSGISAITLWRSADPSFESEGSSQDTPVSTTSYDGDGRVTFSGLDVDVPSSGAYLFVAVDLASDAEGTSDPVLADETDLVLDGGSLGRVNGNDVATFSDLHLAAAGGTTLPVELTELTAHASGTDVVLKWRTASETSNVGFEVLSRPAPSKEESSTTDPSPGWTTLGEVEGAGTTSEPQSYRFVTDPLDPGIHQFRLQQIDASGETHRSRTVSVEIDVDGGGTLSTYPNPTRDEATVEVTVQEKQPVTVDVYNMMGQRVTRLYDGRMPGNETRRLQLDMQDWPSGVYFVEVSGETFSGSRRLTLVR